MYNFLKYLPFYYNKTHTGNYTYSTKCRTARGHKTIVEWCGTDGESKDEPKTLELRVNSAFPD